MPNHVTENLVLCSWNPAYLPGEIFAENIRLYFCEIITIIFVAFYSLKHQANSKAAIALAIAASTSFFAALRGQTEPVLLKWQEYAAKGISLITFGACLYLITSSTKNTPLIAQIFCWLILSSPLARNIRRTWNYLGHNDPHPVESEAQIRIASFYMQVIFDTTTAAYIFSQNSHSARTYAVLSFVLNHFAKTFIHFAHESTKTEPAFSSLSAIALTIAGSIVLTKEKELFGTLLIALAFTLSLFSSLRNYYSDFQLQDRTGNSLNHFLLWNRVFSCQRAATETNPRATAGSLQP